MTRRGLASAEMLAWCDQEASRADVDRRLAEAIKAGPPTILGFFFRAVGWTAGGVSPERLMGSDFVQASTYNLVRTLDNRESQVPLRGATGMELNLPVMIEAAAGDGYFNMEPDADGTVRRLPLAILFGSDFFAPESLVTVDHYLGRPPLAITLSRLGVDEIRLGAKLIPVDRHGRVQINYLGEPGTIPTYSAAALLDGKVPAGDFKDKIVIVGATAVGIYDLRVTPFSGIFPGVEIQATVMDNLLKGNFIRYPPFGPAPDPIPHSGAGGVAGAGAAPAVGAPGVYPDPGDHRSLHGFQLSPVQPPGPATGALLPPSGGGPELRGRFRAAASGGRAGTPADPQGLRVLRGSRRGPGDAEASRAIAPGGERREITILFTDIRGFTAMSEKLDPESLVRLLHDFLNPMSNIIIDQGGTIDKYMGDAIMALFGAPLVQPEHPRLACRAALEMVASLQALNLKWQAEGRPPLKVGVGINSGPVAVGNMGSDRLFDYTAIGDNVNLASRLEGLNKYYGTNILISQSTAATPGGRLHPAGGGSGAGQGQGPGHRLL